MVAGSNTSGLPHPSQSAVPSHGHLPSVCIRVPASSDDLPIRTTVTVIGFRTNTNKC